MKRANLNLISLNMNDENLGYYVGENSSTGELYPMKNLTLDAFNKVNKIIINNLQNNQIQKVDITTRIYTSDDVVTYQLLKSSIYFDKSKVINNKDKIEHFENTLSDNYSFNLQEIKQSIKGKEYIEENKKNPEDEL